MDHRQVDPRIRYSTIVDRIDVEAVENELGFDVIDSKGEEDRGHCLDPFGMHKNGDTTGKLYINREKRVFHCWVCGGGSLLQLVMDVKSLGAAEATEWLAQFATTEAQTDSNFLQEIDQRLNPGEDDERSLPFFNEKVLDRFERDHPWFAERGITDEICELYKLRYDPDSPRGGAIILPHYWQGKLVGWQRRFLDGEKPKYNNTDGFPRENTVWGLDSVEGVPVVVESIPTALYLRSAGHSGVATFGSEVTPEQCRLLRRFPAVFLAPDNDFAGTKWLAALAKYLDKYCLIYVVGLVPGEGSDLGDVEQGLIDLYLRKAIRYVQEIPESRRGRSRQSSEA